MITTRTAYKAQYASQAEKICKLGATDFEIADFFGVNRRTIYKWQQKHPAFTAACKLGKAEADERVKRALYSRAVGYDYEAVKIFCNAEGMVTQVPYVEHVVPDTKAAMQWLFNRCPDEWKLRVEHTGKNGGPLELLLSHDDAKL